MKRRTRRLRGTIRRRRRRRKRRTKRRRRRRRRRRKYSGGYSQGQPLTVAEIKYSIANENFELCGHVSQNRQLKFFSRGHPKGGEDDEGRLSCIPPNAPTIWHTHPRVSKFYPSVEDMCKVLKTTNQTTKSLIFTVAGMWTIESGGKVWSSIPAEVYRRLKGINDELYGKSARGRSNPAPQVLAHYMAALATVMHNAGLQWQISLTPF